MTDIIKTPLKFHCASIADVSHSSDLEVTLSGVTVDSLLEGLTDSLEMYQIDANDVTNAVISMMHYLEVEELVKLQLATQAELQERDS